MTRYRGLRSSSELTPYGTDGLYLPSQYALAVDDPDCPVLIELEVTMIDGQPECTELHCQPRAGRPIASEMLRKVPLRRYLRESTPAYSIRRTVQHGVEVVAATGTGDEPLLLRAARRQMTNEFLREVAAVYEQATTKRVNAVREQLHGSRSSANRWVNEAKERGFIPDSATKEDG